MPPLKIYRGIYCERAYVGGNWNNDLNCGPFYANLYNEPSNTNTNIGAALSYSLRNNLYNAVYIAAEGSKGALTTLLSSPLGEN